MCVVAYKIPKKFNTPILSNTHYVEKDPSTNMKKMAEQLGVSQRTVERKMKQLKELNIIQHEGARKTGSYSLNPNITEEAKEWLLK